MSSESLLKNPKTSLLASSSVLFASAVIDVCSGGLGITLPLIASAGFGILKDVAPEFFGAAFQDTFLNSVSDEEVLKNGDLRRAVGKAVFVLILDESAKPEYKTFAEIVKSVGKSSIKNWESYLDKKFSAETSKNDGISDELLKILPNRLTPYFAKRESELDNVTALTPEIWKTIVKELFQHQKYYPNSEDCLRIGKRLHRDFPKVFRKVLIDDFARDGRAYASMQMRILSEMLSYVVEIKQGNDEIKAEIQDLRTNLDKIYADFPKELKQSDDNFWHEVVEAQQNLIEIQKESLDVQKESRDLLKIIAEKQQNAPKETKIPTKLPVSRFPLRVQFFTGREDVLIRIKNSLKKHKTAALCGVHGLGKSSVVTEFAYLNVEKYEHIFFIRAVGADFDIFIGEIVSDLNIPTDEQTTPAQKLQMFQHWLAKNDNWLLILDNIDDVSAINDCRFTNHTGDVVFTANKIDVYDLGKKVDISKMATDEAAKLLLRHKNKDAAITLEKVSNDEAENARNIAKHFGNSPLAMSFVGSYLNKKRKTFAEFLDNYQDREKNLLENYEFLSNYFEHFKDAERKAVATAFLNTFEYITTAKNDSEKEKFIARAVNSYLKICAFVAPENIPEEFFIECLKKLESEYPNFVEDEDLIEEVKERLYEFSIFDRDSDTKTFSTHRLVQEVMRFKIKDEENRLLAIISETLNFIVPVFDYTNREKVEPYLGHLESFIEYLLKTKENSADITRLDNQTTIVLSYKIGKYNQNFGEYEKAKYYYLICRDICEKIYGNEHQKTATSYNNLGALYFLQGDYPKAEEYYLKSLQIRLNIFGENHPDTAASYNNLGIVYYSQNDYPKAKENHLKVLQIYLNIFGENHPNTAASYNNLGSVYYSQDDYPKAKENHHKVLQIYLNIFGENHPNTAASYNNLGSVYDSQGDYPKAEKNHLKALQIKLNILGENHPSTAMSYNNLGLVYENQNKLTEAEEYYEKALEIFLKFLPENHPYILHVKNNSKRVREKMGK